MSRYEVSGANSVAISEATLAGHNLIGKAISTGRVFKLRTAWVYNAVSEFILTISDCATSSSATGLASATTVGRLPIVCASGVTTQVDIPEPGLKFATGCVATFDASGTIAIGDCGGAGYEE